MRLLNPSRPAAAPVPSVVLAGLESTGKSALFRGLTGSATGTEANFRGSTVSCRRCFTADCACDIVDTPGIRVRDDSATTVRALDALGAADTVVLVARSTHMRRELGSLFEALGPRLEGKRVAVVLTFGDRATPGLREATGDLAACFGVPVVLVDARRLDDAGRRQLLAAIRAADRIRPVEALPEVEEVLARPMLFDRAIIGPLAALAHIVLAFAVPVWLAYRAAELLQPSVEAWLIEPARVFLAALPALPAAILIGPYGLLTLGWYSLLWAFPVVLLIAIGTAFSEETGLHDRTTRALDPWLRRIGLAGRDLVPVLTGFGCNVVAVMQSRACSRCTRSACVSLVAFGSACSYQIGATLSLFGAAGHPWLFGPYLFVLFIVGALHTRFWHGAASDTAPLGEPAFLQAPRARAVWWRVRTVLRQFLLQAMPIFLGICAMAALLEYVGAMEILVRLAAPGIELFGLPPEVAPGAIFSILRKDGLLILHQDGGALLQSLTAGEIFLTVYLASTFTACMVTLWTVRRELGARPAVAIAGRQALTSLASAAAIAILLSSLHL